MEETKKITIEELKESINNNTDCNIEVIKYIPFATKLFIIDKVVTGCIKEDNGTIKVDYARKKYLMDIYMTSLCTNIEFPNDIDIELYDYLKENGIIKMVYDATDVENYYEVVDTIDCELEQKIKLSNSIEGIVRDGLSKLINKIPDEKGMKAILKGLPGMVNKIEPSKLEYLKDVVKYNYGVK